MNSSIAIQILPGVAETSEVVRIVDEVIDYIKKTGLTYYVGPFETTVEGNLDQLMDIAKQAQIIAIEAGAPSVSMYMKSVYRPSGEILTIDEKVTKHHR
ncbi:MAG: thiamine-binding protein [Clostridium sp.]|jgi:uncharacterized protein YqgV (UPF0045/DUF77 family)|nr:thiamine-binding protein [Clostridium sp.]